MKISEHSKPAPMLDVRKAEGTFIAWGFILILLITLGAMTCSTLKDPPVLRGMSVFLWVMLPLLLTILFTGIRNRQNMIRLLHSGTLTCATITSRQEEKSKGSLLLLYHYLCTFEVHKKNGTTVRAEAALPEKTRDQYKSGDTLQIRYLPKDPRLCMEEPSENTRRTLLSKQAEGNIFAIGLICLCITFWGLSAVVSETLALSGQNATLSQWVYNFFELLFSHPSDRLQIELFLLSISLGVMGCAVYLLLSPEPQNLPDSKNI